MRNRLEFTVYQSPSYGKEKGFLYVRIGDSRSEELRKKFEAFMKDKLQPLLWSPEDGNITDAVFVDDYYEFQEELEKESKIDP